MKEVISLTIVLCGALWLIKTIALALGDAGSIIVLIGIFSWFLVFSEKEERRLIKLRKEGGKHPYGEYWPRKYDKYVNKNKR